MYDAASDAKLTFHCFIVLMIVSWSRRKLWVLVGVVCLVSANQVFAQATTGAISGTVHDIQGARVAGATVTVRKLDTNLERSVVSELDGRFRFPGLAIGPYELII